MPAGDAARGNLWQSNEFIGTSGAFNTIIETIEAVAARRCSVVITGETGTGKEMVARQIHKYSDRADKSFIPVDCTTLTGQLFESQLFGHLKGAFTGAIDNTLGFFRAADGGTIFLDEVGEIPLDLQAKLLRVLQEGMVTPLGSTKAYRVDVRVLCATNRDLKEMVRAGTFRADLYYRLNVVTIEIPPLRQRNEDVMLLAEYFLARQSSFYGESEKRFSSEVKHLLKVYHWPGNVRELANVVERAFVLTVGNEILRGALPVEIIATAAVRGTLGEHLRLVPKMEEMKKQLVIKALEHCKGRKVAAAGILGIERRALNRMIDKYKISLSQIKHGSAKN
ncbi:MAG: hypothetical protein A2Y07_01360 [Planctomycetes bacterium GWF2_50_10]|nr:MAG: hypothetical protein A2Y07_01360 [Planctomycetes bacterium GWF2_50_10]